MKRKSPTTTVQGANSTFFESSLKKRAERMNGRSLFVVLCNFSLRFEVTTVRSQTEGTQMNAPTHFPGIEGTRSEGASGRQRPSLTSSLRGSTAWGGVSCRGVAGHSAEAI